MIEDKDYIIDNNLYHYRVDIPWSYVYSDWSNIDSLIYWVETNINANDYSYKGMSFFFKNESDQLMFILKWY